MKLKLFFHLMRVGLTVILIPLCMLYATFLWEQDPLVKAITAAGLFFTPYIFRLFVECIQIVWNWLTENNTIIKPLWGLTTQQRLVGLSLNFVTMLGCLIPLVDTFSSRHQALTTASKAVFVILAAICYFVAWTCSESSCNPNTEKTNKSILTLNGNLSITLTNFLNATIILEICFCFFRHWATGYVLFPIATVLLFFKFMEAWYPHYGLGTEYRDKVVEGEEPHTSLGRVVYSFCGVALAASLITEFWNYQLTDMPVWKILFYLACIGIIVFIFFRVLSIIAQKQSNYAT